MAGIEQRNGRFNVIFRYGGKRYVRSLKTADETRALMRRDEIQETIDLVERGKLTVPEGGDVVTFLMSGGKVLSLPKVTQHFKLSTLFDQFFEALPKDSLEQSTIGLMQIHRRHLERVLGTSYDVQQVTHSTLQSYCAQRAKDKIKGKTASGATIKKELVTLRSVWNWGLDCGHVKGDFPKLKLRLPKTKEQPPFQTWEEIERQIAKGASAELWDSLYLSLEQIEEMLIDIKKSDALPCMYPMIATAAYTGARRSELLRSQLSDVDLQTMMLTIREKKRVKGKSSTRRVPIAGPLASILTDWLANHPGSNASFCHFGKLPWPKSKGEHHGPIDWRRASHFLNQTIKETKWHVLKGWHCFRHSFISNCACKGVDQRMIDAWVGHTTEAMRQRYRHLFPSSQHAAMEKLYD